MKAIELPYIKEDESDIEKLEKALIKFFREHIYLPLLESVSDKKDVLKNSTDDLLKAILSGKIYFEHGKFYGKFDAKTTRELKRLGSKWNKKTNTFDILLSELPIEIKNTISLSAKRLQYKFDIIQRKIEQILPSDEVKKLDLNNIFDATLWKMDKTIGATLKGISVQVQLTDEGRAKLADEYTNNMQKYVEDWTQKEIKSLRSKIQESSFAGNRYQSMVKTIQDSYKVSENKAKFLARQETNLLMSKVKEIRYLDAGVNKYKWACVKNKKQAAGAEYKKGEVRHDHAVLDQTIQDWNHKPIVDQKTGRRGHPGEDFGCRCFAIPIVEFNK